MNSKAHELRNALAQWYFVYRSRTNDKFVWFVDLRCDCGMVGVFAFKNYDRMGLLIDNRQPRVVCTCYFKHLWNIESFLVDRLCFRWKWNYCAWKIKNMAYSTLCSHMFWRPKTVRNSNNFMETSLLYPINGRATHSHFTLNGILKWNTNCDL